jgi:hypothetical protein
MHWLSSLRDLRRSTAVPMYLDWRRKKSNCGASTPYCARIGTVLLTCISLRQFADSHAAASAAIVPLLSTLLASTEPEPFLTRSALPYSLLHLKGGGGVSAATLWIFRMSQLSCETEPNITSSGGGICVGQLRYH